MSSAPRMLSSGARCRGRDLALATGPSAEASPYSTETDSMVEPLVRTIAQERSMSPSVASVNVGFRALAARSWAPTGEGGARDLQAGPLDGSGMHLFEAHEWTERWSQQKLPAEAGARLRLDGEVTQPPLAVTGPVGPARQGRGWCAGQPPRRTALLERVRLLSQPGRWMHVVEIAWTLQQTGPLCGCAAQERSSSAAVREHSTPAECPTRPVWAWAELPGRPETGRLAGACDPPFRAGT